MEFEKSSIERLKRTLYSRNEKIIPKEKRTPVAERKIDIQTDWGTKADFNTLDTMTTNKGSSFVNKFLIGSLLFFIISVLIAGFIFFGGMNMISSNNLDIKITAPSAISSGEELTVGLSIVNENRTDLEEVSLIVDYPDGSLSVGENKPLSRERVDIGMISSGGIKDYTVRSILSGEKESVKRFDFKIEYKIKGSNAVFSKEKSYDVIISSSPIILNVTYPKEINSGDNLTLTIDLISNSSVIVKNSLIKVEFPYGFTFKNSNIKPVQDVTSQTQEAIWSTGDLKDGDKKTITISGVLVGQNLEERSFNISSGTQKTNTVQDFEVALATNVATIGIRKALFDLSVTADIVSSVGRQTPVNITWQNILPDRIINTRIIATISGNVFEKTSVRVLNGGFYRSSDDTVTWDKNSTPQLAVISPGDSGAISFQVASFSNAIQMSTIKNPHININIRSEGERSGIESGTVTSDKDVIIRFPSTYSLSAKTYRNIGPFTNSGPIPPKTDIETTYTITWVITNTNNDLSNVLVSAVLPAGVMWKEEISPLDERLTYNQDNRVVTWSVGNVSYGTGFTYSPREVSFKVGITPSINQVGQLPELVSNITSGGEDTYTGTTLISNPGSLNTRFSDPTYKSTDGAVVK